MPYFLYSCFFFLMSIIAFSTQYIAVAILLSKSESVDSDLFSATFSILPVDIQVVSYTTLVIGIVLMILGIRKRGL